jgi:RNA polymerase sigma-54 factor
MALGPRLDLRQSQTLVMTPQLRQAIQLLQYSNIEVNTFVEQELERNPLLERDDASDAPIGERAALDQVIQRTDAPTDTVEAVRAEQLPSEAASPLDSVHAEDYDAGGPADGGAPMGSFEGRGGNLSFTGDDRTVEDMADESPPLRDHLGEQLRLSFSDPVDRMIGAHLIALLCPAGRLTADPAAIAQAMALPLERIERVRQAMLRFDPAGMPTRTGSIRRCRRC